MANTSPPKPTCYSSRGSPPAAPWHLILTPIGIEEGGIPAGYELVGSMIRNIRCRNARQYLELGLQE